MVVPVWCNRGNGGKLYGRGKAIHTPRSMVVAVWLWQGRQGNPHTALYGAMVAMVAMEVSSMVVAVWCNRGNGGKLYGRGCMVQSWQWR